MNNRLAFLQTFFNGAFEAFRETNSEIDSMMKAWALVASTYSSQPIYRTTIAEFTEWFKQLIDEKSRSF